MSKDHYQEEIDEIDDGIFKHLVEDCPNLYTDRYEDYRKTCMCWGFTVEDGWYEIIKDLSFELEELIVNWKKWHPWSKNWPRASQVKEKWGVLRFYMDGNYTKKMRRLIYDVENKSSRICEECGNPGNRRDLVCVQTLCDDCFKNAQMRESIIMEN
jgi:hypothetical protein